MPVYKQQADNFRIIIEELMFSRDDQAYYVYCIRCVLLRGSHDYDDFGWAPNVRQWWEQNPINWDERVQIELWLDGLLEKDRKSKELPELPAALKPWLKMDQLHLSNATFYETQEWTDSIHEKNIYDFKESICDTLLAIQSNGTLLKRSVDTKRCIELVQSKHAIYILYEKIGFERNEIILLYKIFKGNPDPTSLQQVLKNYRYSGQITREMLVRDAKRAYPDFMLLEPELWFKIQEDNIANLALSPEEENLLQTATFPMFINGQAGSGKSTMLFYLFAHICASKKDDDFQPLYLTYNKRLLDTARKNVLAILKTHPNYAELKLDTKIIETYFHPFQNFILKQLLTPEDQSKFTADNYISFSKFRQAFTGNHALKMLNCLLPNRKQYSPELIWHIIRTYIKGFDFNQDFTIDAYRNLPKKNKSVSTEVYTDVFNSIWIRWYNKFHADYGYWDDQDLIRYVLKKKGQFIEFPAIFCDEAQDFTKIEIELLLKLSTFTKYNLKDCDNIPFSFAGDPYQTINPTGFRWETLTTIFNDRFEKLNQQGLKIRFEPLSQNYRSKPAIIKFTNLLQAFRFSHLDIEELRPQSAWQKMEGVSPCLFTLGCNISSADLKEVANKTIMLIPTDADENKEYEYVQKDAFLSQFIDLPKDKNMPISNIMSASTAKGLEFDRVILYQFGVEVPNAFHKAVNGVKLTDSEYIELSHYFNKLYVAASRARNYLFIIDTEEGVAKFWNYFMNTDFLKTVFEKGNYWHSSDVTPLSKGVTADLANIKEENPLKIAVELEENGILQEDYALLHRAQQYYKLIGYEKEALRCEASAYWHKQDWVMSGKLWARFGDVVKAVEAFWLGQEWQSLYELIENHPAHKSQKMVVHYMLNFNDLSIFLPTTEWLDNCNPLHPTWRSIIAKIQKDFEKNIETDLAAFAQLAKTIAAYGFKDFYNIAGQLYLKTGLYENALRCWNAVSHTEHADYYTAKLQSITDPNERITWFIKLKQDVSLIQYVQQIDPKTLHVEGHQTVFGALLRQNEWGKAIHYPHLGLSAKTKRLLDSLNAFKTAWADGYKKHLFLMLLEHGADGFAIIQQEMKVFYPYFNQKGIGTLLWQRNDLQDILKMYQGDTKTNLPLVLLEDLLQAASQADWDDLDAKTVEKLSAVFKTYRNDKTISPNALYINELFKKLALHKRGLEVIEEHKRLFKSFFDRSDALKTVMNLSNWKDLLEKFNTDLRQGLPGRFIETFVDEVCEALQEKRVTHLLYALQLVGELNKRDDKLSENIKLTKTIAYSDITPDLFSIELREQLQNFIKRYVWERNGWQSELNFQEIATALERVGMLYKSLQNDIYKHIIENEPAYAQWAKRRWLKVATKRADYDRSSGKDSHARRTELSQKLAEWEMTLAAIQMEPNFPNLKENAVFSFQNAHITGLSDAPATDPKRKKLTIDWQEYEIRIACANQLISIEDLKSNRTVDIDLVTQTIGGLDVRQEAEQFWIGEKYSGRFVQTTQVLLEFGGRQLTVAFDK
jgi:superfamily I DNA/RNA helicase